MVEDRRQTEPDRRQAEPSAYARGVKAGQVDQTLANHTVRLDQINGSVERVAKRLTSIDLSLQQIQDRMIANVATVEVTAKALREAAEAQRLAAEARWSPVQKWIAVIVALVIVGGFVITLLTIGG